MRILIQDPDSKAFFDGTGWKAGLEQAKTFESVAQAETVCRKHQLSKALIVVKFEAPIQEISYHYGAQGALLVSKPPTQRIRSLC